MTSMLLRASRNFLILFCLMLGVAPLHSMSHSIVPTVVKISSEDDANFKAAMVVILRHEGGLSNDKDDAGGITKFGISLRYLRAEHLCENGDCKGDPNEVIHLTQTEADQIYFHDWWTRYHYNKIINANVAIKLMDTSINTGASQAHKLMKRALNTINKPLIEVNGILDNETINRINQIEPDGLIEAFIVQEEDFYLDIIKRNPSLSFFKMGWMARAEDI